MARSLHPPSRQPDFLARHCERSEAISHTSRSNHEKTGPEEKYKELYNPSAKQVTLVKVPRFNFIMVDGTIPPNIQVGDAADYQNAVETLYGLSYTLKFMVKQRKKDPVDYPVMPLEGIWWAEGSQRNFTVSRKDTWYFTAMIMQPEPVTAALFLEAKEKLRAKKNPLMLDDARFEKFEEGPSIQVMHLGPYSEEPASIAKLVAFSTENGYIRPTASITRSTLATRAAPRPPSCARFFATRSSSKNKMRWFCAFFVLYPFVIPSAAIKTFTQLWGRIAEESLLPNLRNIPFLQKFFLVLYPPKLAQHVQRVGCHPFVHLRAARSAPIHIIRSQRDLVADLGVVAAFRRPSAIRQLFFLQKI